VLRAETAGLVFGRVTNVVDGDTIDVLLPAGQEMRVRYYGSDTPERGHECYRESSERNAQLVGDGVYLLPDAREFDRFDRLLRYVLDSEGRFVDGILIQEGLATAWREDGAFRGELLALEEQARVAGTGCLWR
jgi:micrococcal nuclease